MALQVPITPLAPFMSGMDRLSQALSQISQQRMQAQQMAQQQGQFDDKLAVDKAQAAAQAAQWKAQAEQQQRAEARQSNADSFQRQKAVSEALSKAGDTAYENPDKYIKSDLPTLRAYKGLKVEGDRDPYAMPLNLGELPGVQLQQPMEQQRQGPTLQGGEGTPGHGASPEELKLRLSSDLRSMVGLEPNAVDKATEPTRINFNFEGNPIGTHDFGGMKATQKEQIAAQLQPLIDSAGSPFESAVRNAQRDMAVAGAAYQTPDKATAAASKPAEGRIEEQGRNDRALQSALAIADRSGSAADRLEARDAVTRMQADFNANDTKDIVTAYDQMQRARTVLASNPNSPAAWAAVRVIFSRASGERGASSEGDIMRSSGVDTQSMLVKIEAAWKQATQGGPSPAIVKDVINAMDSFTNTADARAYQQYKAYREQQSYYKPGGPLAHPGSLAATNQLIETRFALFPWSKPAYAEDAPDLMPRDPSAAGDGSEGQSLGARAGGAGADERVRNLLRNGGAAFSPEGGLTIPAAGDDRYGPVEVAPEEEP